MRICLTGFKSRGMLNHLYRHSILPSTTELHHRQFLPAFACRSLVSLLTVNRFGNQSPD